MSSVHPIRNTKEESVEETLENAKGEGFDQVIIMGFRDKKMFTQMSEYSLFETLGILDTVHAELLKTADVE